MKVLMLSDVYFPRVNGVSTSIRTFRRALAAAGHEIDLICPAYGDADVPEAGVQRIPARRVVFDPEDRMMHARAVLRQADELAGRGYGLIHVQTPFVAHWLGVRLARRLDLPLTETYHTFFEEYLYHYVPLLPRAALRALARTVSRVQCNALDGLVVPSQAMLDKLHGYGIRVPAAVIPTGLDGDSLGSGDGAALRAAHGIAPDRPVLVHVGRLAHEKNVDALLHMLFELRRLVPDVLLLIAGEGPAERHLRALAARLGLDAQVRFLGYLDRAAGLPGCYRAGDAFVFASRTETQGLVLLEAMSLGVPVVSTAVMGTRDIVGPQRGAVAVGEDPVEFAAACARVLGDAALRARLGTEARAFAQGWSATATAGALAGFWQQCIDERLRTTAPCPAR